MDLTERYSPEIREHAKRVASMVAAYGKDYELVALLHDILEDTETLPDELPIDIREDVVTLTRLSTETYFEYINRVKNGSERAKIIKLCDIEDHLNNKETLKPSLKKRYVKAKLILE